MDDGRDDQFSRQLAFYPADRLIFVLGIMERSGTNYLMDLLLTHSDCTPSNIPEDFLLAESHWLNGYVDALYKKWNSNWGLTRENLYCHLRPALINLLTDSEERRRVVCKTPSMENLNLFEQFFPDSRALLLVRDGRAVVESGMKSFNWTFEAATRRWADAARKLSQFAAGHCSANPFFKILRYEDLYRQPEVEFRDILDFLSLDLEKATFTNLVDVPVRGSSEKGSANQVHWTPVAKPPKFDPLKRFSHWKPSQHARFNWLAGDALKLFGYEPIAPAGPAIYWHAINQLHDLHLNLSGLCKRLWRRLVLTLKNKSRGT